MTRTASPVSWYCPHPPSEIRLRFDTLPYWTERRFSIHVRDFQSALDGVIACSILFALLFISSLAEYPVAGLTGAYRDSLLRSGLAIAVALAGMLGYAKLAKRNVPMVRLSKAKNSFIASLLVLLIWGVPWILFGQLSRTYGLTLEQNRLGLAPLALCVGLLSGMLVYLYMTDRFVMGLGATAGILVSSFFGWLLFLSVSVEFALYLLPIILVLTYAGVKTQSFLGPALMMALLMAFFYVCFAIAPWMLGSRQVGYWLMTAVSTASALVAALILWRVPLRGNHYAQL